MPPLSNISGSATACTSTLKKKPNVGDHIFEWKSNMYIPKMSSFEKLFMLMKILVTSRKIPFDKNP